MGVKVLVICDDFYHHEEVIKEGLEFLKSDCELTYVLDGADYPFEDYGAVILAKDNLVSKSSKEKWLTAELERQFEDYVAGGGGLIVLHAGSVICRESAIIKNIAGCAFETHPEQCVVDFVIVSENEITDGASDFAEKDEHYFIDFTAADAGVFLESRSEHGTQPAGYTRAHGVGRVCVLTPGHNLNVFQNAQYQKIIRNAVYWCADKK